jgi:hypothetical protein
MTLQEKFDLAFESAIRGFAWSFVVCWLLVSACAVASLVAHAIRVAAQ